VGNTDAHAKNHSLLHHRDGTVTLAPHYDVAPRAASRRTTPDERARHAYAMAQRLISA
jgi:serine/threonine protein kinase HipA of HipAB toxin-antitoxin module